MKQKPFEKFLGFRFDNRKSKIEKRPRGPKLVGHVALAVAFVLCGVVATAQQPKKVLWIGYLLLGDPNSESVRFEATRLALRERGYIEGENIGIVYRYTANRDRLPEFAAELVRLKVDVIMISAGGGWVQAVKNATKTIPIVMTGVGPILSRAA